MKRFDGSSLSRSNTKGGRLRRAWANLNGFLRKSPQETNSLNGLWRARFPELR
jgi:hypothetical protein